MTSYVVVYARGLQADGSPCPEGKMRCDLGLKIAQGIPDSIIVLGAGIPEYAQRNGASSLSESMAVYLVNNGWSLEKILINPKGYETVGETSAVIEAIDDFDEGGPIIAVSSWYHVFRIWIIWLIFGALVQTKSVKHRIGVLTFLKSIAAVFYSSWIAMNWNEKMAARVRKHIIKRYSK